MVHNRIFARGGTEFALSGKLPGSLAYEAIIAICWPLIMLLTATGTFYFILSQTRFMTCMFKNKGRKSSPFLLIHFWILYRITFLHYFVYRIKHIICTWFGEIVSICTIGRTVIFCCQCFWCRVQILICTLFFH